MTFDPQEAERRRALPTTMNVANGEQKEPTQTVNVTIPKGAAVTDFDPQKAERLATELWAAVIQHRVRDRGDPDFLERAAVMLRAAAERVRELSQHRCQHCHRVWEKDANIYDECGDCYRKHQALPAAEKVIEAAREVLEREATGTRETALSLPWWNDLAQALQEYDRGANEHPQEEQ